MALNALIARIRSETGLGDEVPGLDPLNGNEHARYLFVLEAPGPKAVASGVISIDNPDQTARNFRNQLEAAGITRTEIALWNVVPWYLGNAGRTKIRGAKASDVKQGLAYLSAAVACIRGLECIVLVGSAARQAHVHLSHETRVRILSCHHPSPRVLNSFPAVAAENIAIFRFMAGARA